MAWRLFLLRAIQSREHLGEFEIDTLPHRQTMYGMDVGRDLDQRYLVNMLDRSNLPVILNGLNSVWKTIVMILKQPLKSKQEML